MEFLHPKLLWLAVIIPLLAAYYIFIGRRKATLHVSTLGGRRMPRTLRFWLRPLPILLRLGAIALFIVAIARPVDRSSSREVAVEGIDIALAMDVSSSMMEVDFEPNRLVAAKQVASDFVAGRDTDRFALVAFAVVICTVSEPNVQIIYIQMFFRVIGNIFSNLFSCCRI